jgi:(4-(4-[2-(gamma-L-glutamylamino)ethyl]phenoxymethyl)furan-2-yl)methanamine synthase
MSWLALDIGGAHLKAADGLGFAHVRPNAVWCAPERLGAELEALIASSPPCERLAVTMTAELADCFDTKVAGVRAIVDAVEIAGRGRTILIYLIDGGFASADEVRKRPLLAAASNWHALGTYARRFVPSWPALLLDMGSTTADVIPLNADAPCVARTDSQRLARGELVYTGVERTPICAVIKSLPWQGGPCSVASELFATTADAYLILNKLPEDAHNNDTADGRPRTRAAAGARLARMICADADSFSESDAKLAAAAIRDSQLKMLETGVHQVVDQLGQTPRTVILSGHGEFLFRELLNRLRWPCEVISLSRKLGPSVSRCAPAHALAVLAREKPATRTGR